MNETLICTDKIHIASALSILFISYLSQNIKKYVVQFIIININVKKSEHSFYKHLGQRKIKIFYQNKE